MGAVLARLEAARARGIDVSANQYPWNRASNGLDACLPPWVREGGREALLKRLADPATRERVKADMARESADWENQWLGAGGGDGVMVAEVLSPKLKAYEGKTVAAIAAAERKDPRDVVMDIVLADRANAYCILSIMDEPDVRAALAHPLVSFCTDSGGKAQDGPFAGETSHPRGWGSAARILGYYVREQKLLRLEEAVRKMTSFAAEAAGIPDRGVVKVGLRADLTLFDPNTVAARATLREPQPVQRGHPLRRRQRSAGRGRRPHHGRPPGPGAARPGLRGTALAPLLSRPPRLRPMSIRRLAVRIEDEAGFQGRREEGNVRKVIAFEQVSLDGFFVDAKGDMSWAHKQDPEWNAFVAGNASGNGALLFGRVTYEMMASFWPTPLAAQRVPAVAEGMNRMPKLVFSRTLQDVSWANTTLVKGDLAEQVRKIKQEPGPDLAILGSGSIVSQLARAGLIDEFQIVVNPIVLGKGRTLFEGVADKIALKLTQSRAFGNGNVVLYYAPLA